MENKISIVIPTLKRREHVVNLLHSFFGKISPNVEIVVVEQVEKNQTEFKKIAKQLGLLFSYYYLKKPSTTKAKNIGIEKSKGNIIIFFDDDVLLKSKVDFYLNDFENKNIAAVTGRSVAQGQKVEANNDNTGRISFLGKFSDGYSSTKKQVIDTVIGCNVAWRKEILQKLKGFDEQFTGNAIREESDLSLRAKELGYKILFDPRIEVLHVRADYGGARKTEGRLQWYFDFFSNETYFFLKHRSVYVVPLIMTTRLEWVLRCMFGFGREVSLRSMTTPLKGFFDGYRKYKRYKNENRS